MKQVINFIYGRKNTTLIKYLLSYFLILSVLFLGFYFSVRSQISYVYLNDLNSQAEKRLETVQNQIRSNLISLDQIHNRLKRNINLILSRYDNKNHYQYLSAIKMDEYTIGNNFIDSIAYVSKKQESVLSSGKYIKYEDGVCYIYTGNKRVEFKIDDYLLSNKNQLISIDDDKSPMLLYLPYNDNVNSYFIFYIINMKELENILDNGIFTGVTSICLSSADKEIVTGVNADLIEPYLPNLDYSQDSAVINSQESLNMKHNLFSGFSIIALLSGEALLDQVNIAFKNTYLVLFCLGFLGIIMILIAMRVTYWPLYKLIKKVAPDQDPAQNYIKQLDDIFTTTMSENKKLQEKIGKYRLSMQKSILNSIVMEQNPEDINNFANIDQFFSNEPDNLIFIIRIQSNASAMQAVKTAKFLESSLPTKNSSITLESSKAHAVFMVNYTGIEQHKAEVLLLLLQDLNEETGYFAALSNGSPSPMDIPFLYDNAVLASQSWPQNAVVSFDEISQSLPEKDTFSYPGKAFENLSAVLSSQDFNAARTQIKELLGMIDSISDKEHTFPDFFVHCVLIDILTTIINAMNHMNIKFKSYNELYFETLYYCQSCSYDEKRLDIRDNIEKLLLTFKNELESSLIHTSQIRELIEKNYTSPDFSVANLADTFEVSSAYMSYLFKKKFNKNFTDYIWELRLNKAQEMLLGTDMSIEQISISVGYLNTSSFRRKFKQMTGVTPSQYREGGGTI